MLKISLLIIALFFQFQGGVSAETHGVMYSEKGYPYDLLIRKTDEIKILHTLEDDAVVCRVTLDWKDKHHTTKKIQVSLSDFKKEPLASCLPRGKAKEMLAIAFS